MLVTKQPVLKRFWYPVLPLDQLGKDPVPFQLLGEEIVIWRDLHGQAAAVADCCCHRSAKLSLGKVNRGLLACPYHGWEFDRNGRCQKIPQLPDRPISVRSCVRSHQVAERYGYAWVCLAEEPLTPLPDVPEAVDETFRLIPEFYETWRVAGLRVMENEFDTAHPAFVHTGTFGSDETLLPERLEITECEYGIQSHTILEVVNNELQQQNLKIENNQTVRRMDMVWYMPFTCKVTINYPNGLSHIIVNTATPIDDRTSQMVQFCLRNDSDAEAAAEDVVAFDRAVTLEDKAILESTNPDVPLHPRHEQHIFTDKPGLLMRRKLLALLVAHGEEEQTDWL